MPVKSPPESAAPPGHRCASCGAPLHGRYCARCGERRLRDDEFSLRRFLADALQELTGGSTSRLWRTVRTLALRPGHLTREYMEGRRKPWLRPIQIFLLANLAYFLIQPLTAYGGYNTTLASQLDRQPYSDALDLRGVVDARVQALGMSIDTYQELYDQQSANLARTLVILLVPLTAAVLALLLFWRRVPLVQHLVFALHFHAWNLLFVMSLFLLVWYPFYTSVIAAFGAAGVDVNAVLAASGFGRLVRYLITEMPNVPLWLAYLYLGLRRSYQLNRPIAAAAAAALTYALIEGTIAYRLMLFWATVWTL